MGIDLYIRHGEYVGNACRATYSKMGGVRGSAKTISSFLLRIIKSLDDLLFTNVFMQPSCEE